MILKTFLFATYFMIVKLLCQFCFKKLILFMIKGDSHVKRVKLACCLAMGHVNYGLDLIHVFRTDIIIDINF